MHSDPIHQYRSLLNREMLTLYRDCRRLILRTIRDELTQRQISTGDLQKRVSEILKDGRFRATRSMDRYVHLLYQRGIDRTISDIMFLDKSVQIDARFSDSDMEMIGTLSTDAYQSVDNLHKKILDFVDKAAAKALKDKSGVNRAVKETYDRYNSTILPLVEDVCTSVSCRAYNTAAFRIISAYAPGKKWIGPDDGFTRKSHKALIGTVIRSADLFALPEIVSGKTKAIPACEIRYPGDISNNPPDEQVRSCRCWIVPDFTALPEAVPDEIDDRLEVPYVVHSE